ncbi:autotransporter outer membrane beta-barrel domain-containing protein [Bradyrhizobium sp. CCGB20]|uniref:autotransporter outer membrane beta-barrel domain-containing protein n=1 Tax=Bradyrhizobium sp. CCGB20 TaxID=2949633 RepID=UPI0020B2421E|nr:autotransporter outer membrane beta-barrel domain-containing protein [Bradyrhizobium sp. CCGB20]MCP3399899.1 autotransporter outer membrane beta-barrel domain-containing protein [Bradyrhizobium sp. CCGB20]
MRARLSLLLLTAGLLLPGAAAAETMREFGAFAGMPAYGAAGPNMPGYGFNNFANPAFGGAPFGGPQTSTFSGAWFGNGGGGGGMQPGYGWNGEPPGLAGEARFGMRQSFGGGADSASRPETAQATFLAMTQFMQTLLDPAIDGRSIGPAEFDAELAAYADLGNDQTHGGVGREAYGAIYGKPSLASAHWNVWAAGFGGSQVSTGGGSASRSFGTVVGADYSLSPQTRMGFALAGGGTGFANNLSSGRSDLFQAGAFVRHSVGPAYVATALAYGWQAITGDYQVTPAGSSLNAAVNANAYSGRLEGGYRFAMPWLGITPYAAAQITTFRLPSNTAQPAYAVDRSPAAPGDDGFTDTRAELGLRTSTSFALFGSVMNLRGRLAWAHDFSAGRSIPPAFQSLPGQGFIVGGTALAPNAALTGVALELRDLNGWSASANLDSEVSSLVRSYTGKAILRYAW